MIRQANDTANRACALASAQASLDTLAKAARISLEQVPPSSDFNGVSKATYVLTVRFRNDGGDYATSVEVGAEPMPAIVTQLGATCPSPSTNLGTPQNLTLGADETRDYTVTVPGASVPPGTDPVLTVLVFWSWKNFNGGDTQLGCYSAKLHQGGGQATILGLPATVFNSAQVNPGARP